MHVRKTLFTLSALVFALQAPIKLIGQTADSPSKSSATQSPVSTIQVFSREVLVDVIVTDAGGQPVLGLKQSDFLIEEDGKPQPIRSFGEFDRGFDGPTLHTRDQKPEVRTNFNDSPATGPVNIILIDALHLNFVAANRALQAVSDYASRMPSGTELAVFWLGASGLHMLQGFTSDPAALQNAVAVQRTDIGSNQSCYATDRLTIDAFNQIAAYVSAIKGRKNLIWITPGAPVYLLRDGGYGWGTSTQCNDVASEPRAFGGNRSDGPSLFTDVGGNETPGLDMSEVHHLMDTYELFTAEQIAVSPFNASGVGGIGTGDLVAEQVAQQSGGFASYNSNDFSGRLADIIDKSSHYYTLSYFPPRRKNDGHYHHIKVQIARPALHLVYREGYNAEDPHQPRTFAGPELIKAALQGRVPPATQIVFDAKLVRTSPSDHPVTPDVPDVWFDPTQPQPSAKPPAPQSPPQKRGKAAAKQARRRTPYDLYVALPQNQIALGTAPDGSRTVKLQFAFDAYDLNGKFLGSHAQTFSLNLTPERFERFRQAPVIFHEQILFLSGPLFLRVGVLDNTSNKVGTLEVPLTIP